MYTRSTNPRNWWEICVKKRTPKNGNWNDEQLKGALRAIDVSSRVLMASKEFYIPISISKNHLFGELFGTTIGRKWGKKTCSHQLKKRRL